MNLSAMKLFGCRLGRSIEDIDGSFQSSGYDYCLHYLPDTPYVKVGTKCVMALLCFIQKRDVRVSSRAYIVSQVKEM